MKCCDIEYRLPVESSQTFIYGGILLAGFFVYFLVRITTAARPEIVSKISAAFTRDSQAASPEMRRRSGR